MEARDIILKATLRQFMQKGYEKTSMNDIVEESNYTKGAIYHHFKNKRQLYLEVIIHIFKEFHEWEYGIYRNCKDLRELLYTYFDTMHRVKDFLVKITDQKGTKEHEFLLLITEAITKFPEIKKLHSETHKESLKKVISIFQNAKEQGLINSEISLYTLSVMIQALNEGTMIYHILNEKLDLEKIAKEYSEIVWNTIKKR
ncbi:MAG: helix-turn-helix domain-containing protein [Candidatus Cloacimonadota bacterium]|nr:helix-turn-helix domain-containing protein [Candidatus Cloacimonadota bacterium]